MTPSVNLIEKRARMSREDIIRYQLMTYCFFKPIEIISSELDCLVWLSIIGQTELNKFCEFMTTKGIYGSAQSTRNCINRLANKNLITKVGKNRIIIYLDKDIDITSNGNILLDYKFAYKHVAQES